jgi:hypothetical protein
MVSVMGVVISHDTPVVTSMDVVIDIGEVVASNLPCYLINPYFPAQLPVSSLVGNLVGLINDFYLSHDASYHG